MRQYIMIILIALHLLGSNIYAKKAFLEQNHAYTSKCDVHEHMTTHEHHHFHNGSQHTHKHSHSQVNVNFLDFYTHLQNKHLFSYSNSKQIYSEQTSWIPNPVLRSLFRPPKV